MSPRFWAIEIMKIPLIDKKKTARDFFDSEKIGDFAFGYVEFELLVISQICGAHNILVGCLSVPCLFH